MAARSARRRKAFHWIPPNSTANYKFQVIRSDGTTTDDLTSQIVNLEIEDGVTDTIGRFSFSIWNPNETYTGVWTGNEIVKYYSDYAATASTLRFRGRIEKIIYSNNQIKVSGRSESFRMQELTVTKSFSSSNTNTILKSLIDSYGPDFTYTNVTDSDTQLTVNWHQKPFWEAVTELTTASGYDIYVDANLDFHFFKTSSVTNKGEAIVHSNNLLDMTEFADDLTFVKNRIIVYGAKTDGIQVIATAEDTTSQSNYQVREEIINDDNMTNETQAQELADYTLAKKKDPPQIGEVTGQLLATIQPGERIGLSSPTDNLPPGWYDIISYKHKVGSQSNWTTTVKVTKEPRRFSHIMKQMIERDNKKVQASINPNEMRYSYNHLYDTSSGTLTNTSIADGILKATVNGGTWVSDSRTLSSNISQAYLIIVGTDLGNITVQVSGNDGVNYQTITNKQLIDMTTATGTKLKIKVTFTNTTSEIDSLSILYKL